jgi:hypothetical protein
MIAYEKSMIDLNLLTRIILGDARTCRKCLKDSKYAKLCLSDIPILRKLQNSNFQT